MPRFAPAKSMRGEGRDRELNCCLQERIPVSFYDQALARAQVHEQSGEFAQAEKIYEQVLRGDPLLAVAWHRLGGLFFRLERIEQAAESLGRAASLDPSNTAFLCDLGAIYRKLGRVDDAVDYF